MTILVLQGEYLRAPFWQRNTVLTILLGPFTRQLPDSIYQINF